MGNKTIITWFPDQPCIRHIYELGCNMCGGQIPVLDVPANWADKGGVDTSPYMPNRSSRLRKREPTISRTRHLCQVGGKARCGQIPRTRPICQQGGKTRCGQIPVHDITANLIWTAKRGVDKFPSQQICQRGCKTRHGNSSTRHKYLQTGWQNEMWTNFRTQHICPIGGETRCGEFPVHDMPAN